MAPTSYDEKPKDGDLIEVFRGPYEHWAVYVGDGFVVHLAPLSEVPGAGASSIMSVTANKAIVKKEELYKVVGSHEWKIHNSLDEQYKPRLAHVIVRQACALVGDERPYCIVRDNCEHFANELRYGKKESRQVRVAVKKSLLYIAVGGVVGFIAYLLSGGRKENKNTE